MKILCLDISTKTGFAFFNNDELQDYGVFTFKEGSIDYLKFSGESIDNALKLIEQAASRLIRLCQEKSPDVVVIEQTNLGRARFSQKIIEWIHCAFLMKFKENYSTFPTYLDSSYWRKKVNLRMSKEDKRHNKMIKETKGRGKLTRKHLAVRMVNEMFNKEFKVKDNDICDAILLGVAYLKK